MIFQLNVGNGSRIIISFCAYGNNPFVSLWYSDIPQCKHITNWIIYYFEELTFWIFIIQYLHTKLRSIQISDTLTIPFVAYPQNSVHILLKFWFQWCPRCVVNLKFVLVYTKGHISIFLEIAKYRCDGCHWLEIWVSILCTKY